MSGFFSDAFFIDSYERARTDESDSCSVRVKRRREAFFGGEKKLAASAPSAMNDTIINIGILSGLVLLCRGLKALDWTG